MNKIKYIVVNEKRKTEAEELYEAMLEELAMLWIKRNRISNPDIVLILDVGLLTVQDAIINFRKVDVPYVDFLRYNKLCKPCGLNDNYRFEKHQSDNKLKYCMANNKWGA